MDYQLDTRDYRCPLPLLMIKKALAPLKKGDSLLVLISSESSVADIQQLCEALGYICQQNDARTVTIFKFV